MPIMVNEHLICHQEKGTCCPETKRTDMEEE